MLIRRCFRIWISKEFLLVNEVGRAYYHMWEERICMEKSFTRKGSSFQPSQLVWEKSCCLYPSQSRACACEPWLSHLDQVDPAWAAKASVHNVYWRNICPARRVTLPSFKRVTILAKLPFVFHVNSVLSFIRKRTKSWVTEGGLGRWATHLSRTSSLYVKGA